jgi:hypothetical protein
MWLDSSQGSFVEMPKVTITRKEFQDDRQGRTFADVVNDPEQPFGEVLDFFNDQDRQRRMEESELHHDRPPLAGVVRELESRPAVDRILASSDRRRTKRLRQAVGVVIRIIMERRGWRKTGRKGSLGVRAASSPEAENPGPFHNSGGLAFWFLRGERYELEQGMPFRSVRARYRELENASPRRASASAQPKQRRTQAGQRSPSRGPRASGT